MTLQIQKKIRNLIMCDRELDIVHCHNGVNYYTLCNINKNNLIFTKLLCIILPFHLTFQLNLFL